MFERFTERARLAVTFAGVEARDLKHAHIGTEHILLGLIREQEGIAGRVLESFDFTHEKVRALVLRVVGGGEEAMVGTIPFTNRAKKVLELTLREALSLGHDYIGTEHILLGLLRQDEGVAARIIEDVDVPRTDIRNEVIRHLTSSRHPPLPAQVVSSLDKPAQDAVMAGRQSARRSRRAEVLVHDVMSPLLSEWLSDSTQVALGISATGILKELPRGDADPADSIRLSYNLSEAIDKAAKDAQEMGNQSARSYQLLLILLEHEKVSPGPLAEQLVDATVADVQVAVLLEVLRRLNQVI